MRQPIRLMSVVSCLLSFVALPSSAKDLYVGIGKEYSSPSAAISQAKDGDHIYIDAGQYRADYATIIQSNLIIEGVGGRAHLIAGDDIPNRKAIWVVNAYNLQIKNLEFSNARVPDRNGAGIRHEGGFKVPSEQNHSASTKVSKRAGITSVLILPSTHKKGLNQ